MKFSKKAKKKIQEKAEKVNALTLLN